MRRMIELSGEHYQVTVFDHDGGRFLQVDSGESRLAGLSFSDSGEATATLGDVSARMRIAVSGDTAYIRAFGRTFTLRIADPVEQAAQEAGSHVGIIRAPMPGLVVDVAVAQGERVVKGQAMMTIESMKILTVITAPRNGEVEKIHFQPGQAFDRNAALVTLKEKSEN
jgi:biotin carboxyl carrier protein